MCLSDRLKVYNNLNCNAKLYQRSKQQTGGSQVQLWTSKMNTDFLKDIKFF